MQIRNNGNVGIGNFGAPFSAAERLHLRESSGNPSVFLMTGNYTGDNSNDGFHISLNNNATATLQSVELNLFENSNMNFLTNNTQRMRITGDGNVGIGSVTPVGKLFVVNDVNTTVLAPAVYANSTATTSGYSATGVQSLASASGSNGDTYAIDAQASGSGNFNVALKLLTTSNASNNYGIYSNMGKGIGYYSTVTGTSGSTTEQNGGITVEVANGAYVGGVSGKASNGVTSNTGGTFEANGGTNIANWNVGVHGIAQYGYASGCINRGVHGYSNHALSTNAGTFYGVSGYVNVEQANDYAGFFEGKVYSTVSFTTSDSNLKSNVTSLNGALAIIDQLLPKTYSFKTNNYSEMNLPQGIHAGLIAQQVEQVLPQVVGSAYSPDLMDALGNVIRPAFHYKVLNYTELIPYLIAAIKEQQAQIQALQMAQNPVSPTPSYQKEIKLTNKATLILDQNFPNPFKENTTINYNIPDDVKQAQILFYNSKGNVINSVDITERGAGSLLVYGQDLTNGVYTYSLLADNKLIETKRMIKLK